ncbi:MAG: hypothetical protein CFE40_06555 [Burkholderiales bacterium PBB1]|nr:MAG: hypothetical protein CFE40_06555 [Burkholderiales bacterium PBB1]
MATLYSPMPPSLSLRGAQRQPPDVAVPRAAISHEVDGGPGWYGSSWELGRGLEIAEAPDAEAELTLWIEACLNPLPTTEPA